jgi:hypothetical protein
MWTIQNLGARIDKNANISLQFRDIVQIKTIYASESNLSNYRSFPKSFSNRDKHTIFNDVFQGDLDRLRWLAVDFIRYYCLLNKYSNVRNSGSLRNSGLPEKVRHNDNARISHSKISKTERSRSKK